MSKDLHCSLIQTNLSWEDKVANRKQLEEILKTVPKETQIVIFPEMFNTGFSMNATALAEPMDGPTVSWMRNQAMQHKKIICGSLIISDNDLYFNRLIWMLPNGDFHHYDKKHLFAKANEDQYYQAGDQRVIVQVNGWKILLQTCYDLRFPVWARQSKQLYDVIINVANWPAARSTAWKTLLRARAIENQCYMLGVNIVGTDGNNLAYSGDSAAIDYAGEYLWTESFDNGIGNVSLSKSALEEFRNQFPFLQDRDTFMIT